MHHKIDVHPIPDSPIYINDLSIATTYNPYELKRQAELAVTGKTVSKGGILPDDNVRVYVPLDINAEYIIGELYIHTKILILNSQKLIAFEAHGV